MKKILGITGIRSDYDLLSSLYTRLARTPEVDLRLLVGGAHMSRTYGHTVDMIRDDGIAILQTVESLIDGDSLSSRIKTASIMLQGAIDSVAAWSPDLIVYAGDREEVWIGALIGTYLEIPTAHFYAGDHTRTGHVDNPIRHAVSKLSTAHFVSVEEHKSRLIAMGEDERRIFVVGNLSLDNFVSHPATPFPELQQKIGIDCESKGYALVLFHPDPAEKHLAGQYVTNILDSLREANIFACVGYPNTDPSNRDIIQVVEERRDGGGMFVYRNLAREDFISLYKGAKFIIGNSSSGIMEAASVPVPAINVGLRQRGRLAGSNVVFCDGDRESIRAAIRKVDSPGFLDKAAAGGNPYGDGRSSEKAAGILMTQDFDAMRLKTEDPLDAINTGEDLP